MSPSVSHAHRGLLHLPHVGTPKSTGPTWRRALSKAAATGDGDGEIQNVDAPTLPETGRTVSAPPVVALPRSVAARCPIVDPNLAPGRSAVPVGIAALRLTVRRSLRLPGCGSGLVRLRRACGRGHCFARFRQVAWLAGAGGGDHLVDDARGGRGDAAQGNGCDRRTIGRDPNHARLARLDETTVALGPGVAHAGWFVRGGRCALNNGALRTDERRQARSRNAVADGCLIDRGKRYIQFGTAGRGHDACADPRHSETSQRQTQPATKPRGGTEKTEFRVDVLGRGHGNSPPAWPRSPTLMEVHEMRRRSRLFPPRAFHNFGLHSRQSLWLRKSAAHWVSYLVVRSIGQLVRAPHEPAACDRHRRAKSR